MTAGAGWHPDPSGRHEYRYWNGWYWTDAVADHGVATADPPGPSPSLQTSDGAPPQGEPAWVVALSLILFFPIGLLLAWREPWRRSTKLTITAAVVIVVLGGGVAAGIALHDRSTTAAAPRAVNPSAGRAAPTTTSTSVPATPAGRFLHAVHDPRAGRFAVEDDASLLHLARVGCNALRAGLPPSFLSSSMHTTDPSVTPAQARYFVGSLHLLCPHP